MVGKKCSAKGSGSAGSGGLVEYLVGYAVAEKGATRDEIQDALNRVFAEGEARADRGAGVIWKPEAGEGSRPSSVLVRNCGSFTTASLEMDADAAGNAGVAQAANHFVWSFSESESGRLTDEQIHQYVGEVLDKLGLSEYKSVAVIHRDTIVYDRNADGSYRLDPNGNRIVKEGNVHCHVAVGSVHPETGLAYDQTGLWKKMAWAEREVEMAHGLEHDNGLAVVRDAGTARARVEWASPDELKAWRIAREGERLAALERKAYELYDKRDATFARYADATVAPRLRAVIELAESSGRPPSWATLHMVAARHGCEFQTDGEGRVILREVGVGEMRLQHNREREDLRAQLKDAGVKRDEIDQQIAEMRTRHVKEEAELREHKRANGETVLLDDVLHRDENFPPFENVEESERAYIAQVERDPSIVIDEIANQHSTFSRAHIDRHLAHRISNPEEIQRLSDVVVQHESIRVREVDTAHPMLTTQHILDVEAKLRDDARALAQTSSGITPAQVEKAIATYEAEQTAKLRNEGKLSAREVFKLSGEQRNAVHLISKGSLVSLEGLPGTGKTTVMGCVRVVGEQTGRQVVGLTTSAIAAERLQKEAGFKSVNTAAARVAEERGEEVIPPRSIVVIDEGAMVGSAACGRIMEDARSRGCIVVDVYDTRQMQPIEFGQSARIVKAAASEAATHGELNDIQRQKREWHREAVKKFAFAIGEKDDAKREKLMLEVVEEFDKNGALRFVKDRDAAISECVKQYRAFRAMGYADTLMPAGDKDTVRHLSEEDRRLSNLEGKGLEFWTQGGRREVAVGDRLMFLENSQGKTGIGVWNGDRGEVVAVQRNQITVRLENEDGEGRVVRFNPKRYTTFDYANACTHMKTQGASIGATSAIVDSTSAAETAFMAVSRSTHEAAFVIPQTSYADKKALAKHLAREISLKTTTLHYDEVLERTGGKETIRVLNMEAQRDAAPMRRLYDAEIAKPAREIRDKQVAKLREALDARRAEIAKDPKLTLEERLEQNKRALSEFRKEAAAVYHDTKPEIPFGAWLEQREAGHERARIVQHNREAEHKIEKERQISHERTDNRQHGHDQEQQQERHGEIER